MVEGQEVYRNGNFGNGANQFSPLPNLDYYMRILNEPGNRGKILRLHPDADFIDLAGIKYTSPPLTGLLSRTALQRVTLFDGNGNDIDFEILLKVTRPGVQVIDTSNRHHQSFVRGMQYQYDHMKFWNSVGILSPIVLDLSSVDHERQTYYYLAMEFWDGMTHDLNVLALEASKSGIMSSHKLDPEQKREYARAIDEERSEIVNSSIMAIREFHLLGTQRLPDTPTLDVFIPDDVETYFLQKRGIHYLRRLLTYGTTLEGRMVFQPKYVQKDIEGLLREFSDLFMPLLEPFFMSEKFVYAQGDEYLHHLQFRDMSGSRETGMFDSDHVMMTRPEYSYAKLLTSHLLNLKLEEEMKFVLSAFFSRGENYDPTHFVSANRTLGDYLVVSLITRLLDMGKRASDGLINVPSNARLVSGVSYDNQGIRSSIPEGFIPSSVRYPDVVNSLRTQISSLDDRLGRIGRGEFNDILINRERNNMIRNISALREFLGKCGILG